MIYDLHPDMLYLFHDIDWDEEDLTVRAAVVYPAVYHSMFDWAGLAFVRPADPPFGCSEEYARTFMQRQNELEHAMECQALAPLEALVEYDNPQHGWPV